MQVLVGLPQSDRVGSILTFGFEPKAWRPVQLPDLRPQVVMGRVEMMGAVPAERLAVLLRRSDDLPVGGMAPDRSDAWRRPLVVPLAADGGFRCELPPGGYRLQIADGDTGLCFHTESHELTVDGDAAPAPLAIRPPLQWLNINFESTVAGGAVAAGGIYVRPAVANAVALGTGLLSPRDHHRAWLPLFPGMRGYRFLVPPGSLEVAVEQHFTSVYPGHVGEVIQPSTVVIDRAEQCLTIRLPPPPR